MLLNICLEEEIQDITLLMEILELDVMLLSKCTSCLKILNFIPVNTAVLLNSINHCDSFKWLTEIHLDSIVRNLCCTKNFLSNVSVHVLSKVHHAVIICICLIKLHKSELRVMTCINTFVSEYTADLINSLKTTNDKSLKVKLKRYTKLKVFIKSVEMSFERTSCGTTCISYKHRCLNFHKALCIKISSDSSDDL